VVSRCMYGAGALVWSSAERRVLEKQQCEFGRWLWGVERSVRNGCIQGETGWSSFEEREARAKMAYVRKIYKGGSLVAEVGRGALLELGQKSPWWREIGRIANRYDLDGLHYLLKYRRVSDEGQRLARIPVEWLSFLDEEWFRERVWELSSRRWVESLQSTARTRQYASLKREPRMEEYADGGVGARVRMMVRGDSLLVRECANVRWKYASEEERRCQCGEPETERHVLLECLMYEGRRVEWKRVWEIEMGECDMMEGVTGFIQVPGDLEKLILVSVGNIWRDREKVEWRRREV
jgi:hypothetical protein